MVVNQPVVYFTKISILKLNSDGKLGFSDAFALECRDRRPRRSATVRPKILSSQGYLWTVEDAGPYGFIFTLTDKPKFED